MWQQFLWSSESLVSLHLYDTFYTIWKLKSIESAGSTLLNNANSVDFGQILRRAF